MRHGRRSVPVLTILVCLLAVGASSKAQTSATNAASVSGRVTIHGKAASGIFVGVRPAEAGTALARFSATTDEQGHYEIVNLPTGSYQIIPIVPAYAARSETVIVVAGQSVDGVDFDLVRGGVITGRVTDAEGRAVIEQRVSLLPADPPRNQKGPIAPIKTFLTDDLGVYRMFGLVAGRYKIATGQSNDTLNTNAVGGRPSYKQTFHPDVTEAAKATVVQVTEGSEISNVDITIGRAIKTFTARGRVVDGEDDQPLGNVSFKLQVIIDAQRRSPINNTATSNSSGEFQVEDLAPGKYQIFLQPLPGSDVRADPIDFEVVDQDVEGVVVRTLKGASVAGRAVLADMADREALVMLPQLRINGNIEPQGAPVKGHSVSVNSDGAFLLHGLESGVLRLSLGAQDAGLLKRFRILRVTRDGLAQPKGLEIKPGEQITGVRVVVSYGNATVYGAVNLVNGALPKGSRIVVRATKPGRTTSSIRSPQVDPRGHFLIEGLAAGTYEFTATVVIPRTGAALRLSGKQVAIVTEDAVTQITITVDLKQASASTLTERSCGFSVGR